MNHPNPPESPASSSGGGGAGGDGYPSKRARTSPATTTTTATASPPTSAALAASITSATAEPSPPGDTAAPKATTSSGSNFRNVSACNRCRLRKNRCDQRLPSCASCAKAGVKCVGYDPITKREIPRSYVFYLEARVAYLEDALRSANVAFAPADVLEHSSRPGPDPNATHVASVEGRAPLEAQEAAPQQRGSAERDAGVWAATKQEESTKLDNLVSNVGMISVQGASDPRYLGSTSGISFARVVFAAVKSSVAAEKGGASSNGSGGSGSGGAQARGGLGFAKAGAGLSGGTSMRDSFFGLQTKPSITPAPFPERALALRLVNFYFEHANPQVPILHRGEFMRMFEAVYGDESHVRSARESYMLNIVYAIGAGIYLGDPDTEPDTAQMSPTLRKAAPAFGGRQPANTQCQPEEYHASAIVHLEACLQPTMPVDRPDGFGGGLEELQAVLLLAAFAVLRPVAPGLWYITGVAVRLAVDLGLHYEDGKDIDAGLSDARPGHPAARRESVAASRERGRREWTRDLRRRLWWCTYSYDRLVSTCVGRPFGISDQAITTEFPSALEDKFITPHGFLAAPADAPSSKRVAHHYFRFRQLQSEILQVLQHQQAAAVRASSARAGDSGGGAAQLPSPFLARFGNEFRAWRVDVDRRLWEWKSASPGRRDSGVQFSHQFLELNYWQSIIMLYRQSLSTPAAFAGEVEVAVEAESPAGAARMVELREDEQRVFLKVAEAGQKVLRLYRQLHRVHLVNYTFLATHHLFMAGISFLYAIWHSPIVRSRLTMDEVDFTILAATSVLGDLVRKCPPAEACRDAFDRMSTATVQMCMSTTGFSSSAAALSLPLPASLPIPPPIPPPVSHPPAAAPRPRPHFDMSLNDLLYTPATPLVKTEPPHFAVDPALLPPPPSQPPLDADDTGLYAQQPAQSAFGGDEFAELGFLGDEGGGLDLGFGWGAEGEGHDFREGGNQLDFFDGFYFGAGV